MKARKATEGHLLRFFKGEELMEGITQYAGSEGITAASVRAIGATTEIELGFYSLAEKAS